MSLALHDWAAPPNPPGAASFRDPAGRLLTVDGRLIRIINRSYLADLRACLESATGRALMAAGLIVGTNVLEDTEAKKILERRDLRGLFDYADVGMVVEQERVPFPTFPYEWPPEMLYEAGCLTLGLAEALLEEDLSLKDATPYNVLFRGTQPTFVDLLSFERLDPRASIWLPYAQFVRTFVLPLLLNKHFGISMNQVFITHRDGVEPEEVYRLCGPMQKFKPSFLALVSLPTWLSSTYNQNPPRFHKWKASNNPQKVRFVRRYLFKHLRRMLSKVEPRDGKRSVWSDYLASGHNYSQAQWEAKRGFVETVMDEFGVKRVLDVGSNTGHFSLIAARRGAKVIAIDADPVVVGQAWREARAEGLDILPLVVNLTRPTPAIGWRNQECPAFLHRTRGVFDAVFMLAVIHHMLARERIPLHEVIDLAAELTTDLLVIEFVAPDDPMFRRLTAHGDGGFDGLTPEFFEATCWRHFEIIRSQHLDGTQRWLYLLRKKRASGSAPRPRLRTATDQLTSGQEFSSSLRTELIER